MSKMSSKMQKTNKSYYSSKGKKIYSDFSTFAQGKALANCNAIEFCRDFASHQPPVTVCEYGIGKGDFAKTFLDEVKRKNKRLYAKTRYYLFDFSDKMIADARKNLLSHRSICIFGKFDAAHEQPDLHYDYCRINELLTDLPAEIYMKKNGKIHDFQGKEIQLPSPVVSSFLARMDDGRAIPFNFVSERFILSLCILAKPRSRIDIFDYGFYSADDILQLPKEEWNRLLVRNYGGQLTADLNIPQLLSSLAAQGISAKAEKQKSYCEKITGKKLEMTHTKGGLDYSPAKQKEIKEDDGFYHIRIGR